MRGLQRGQPHRRRLRGGWAAEVAAVVDQPSPPKKGNTQSDGSLQIWSSDP